jgi:hypothetical protein
MFHPIACDIGLSQWRDSYARLSCEAKPTSLIAGAVAIALLVFAPVSARADSSRMARENHACAAVMGLHQPGDLYDTCIRSLRRSLSELDQARLAQRDRSTCFERGLKPGTRAFAACALPEKND